MGDHVRSDDIVGTHTIQGRVIEVHRLTWRHDPGLSFDLIDQKTRTTLTMDESFDDYPGEDVMEEAVTGFFDSTARCRFCSEPCGGSGHLIGAATPDENPWCCDDCWDERLR